MKTRKTWLTYAIFSVTLLFFNLKVSAQVGVGTNTPNASAALDVVSANDDTGVLFPRLTTTQRDAITSPATGLLVYNTTTNTFDYNMGTPGTPNWISLSVGSSSSSLRAKFSNTDVTTNINPAAFSFIPLFDTTVFNDDATLFQLDNTSQITVTQAGLYRVTLNMRLLGVNGPATIEENTNVLAGVVANGTRVSALGSGYISFQDGNIEATITLTDIVSLNANDTVGIAAVAEGNTGEVRHAFAGDSVFIIEKLD